MERFRGLWCAAALFTGIFPGVASADRPVFRGYDNPGWVGHDAGFRGYGSPAGSPGWRPYGFDRDNHRFHGRGPERDCDEGRYPNSYHPSYGGNYGGFGWSGAGYQLRNGYRSGQLSVAELRELRQKESEICAREAAYKSDGRLSPRERSKLRDLEADFRDDLHHELTDGERRY